MKKSVKNKLKCFYRQFKSKDNVLVMINADPDSMGSAMAIRRLLRSKVQSVTVSNINIIERPDNLAFVRLLNVKMTHADRIEKNNFNRFVIVDSQPDHHEIFLRYKYDAIIDHHPVSSGQGETEGFVDIRVDYGACSSILTEYLRAAGIKPSVKLSTQLFLGIKTDTQNFQRHALSEDMRAFQYLFRFANMDIAGKIEQSEIKIDQLRYYSKALVRRKLSGGKLFTHLGAVNTPDVCVNIADFFMKVENIKWSIVSGIHNKTLIIVFRNDGIRKNAGKLAKKSFKEFGIAGGHESMARAEIPVHALRKAVKNYKISSLTRWIIYNVGRKQ